MLKIKFFQFSIFLNDSILYYTFLKCWTSFGQVNFLQKILLLNLYFL
nr:MAG TPA: hypothetical protein [Caudoviricetes sp.]